MQRRRPSGFQHTHSEGEAARLAVIEQNSSGEAAADKGADE